MSLSPISLTLLSVRGSGFDEIILVGHSMAGLTLPGVAEQLGAGLVREMVYVGSFVPQHGSTIADSLHGPFVRLVKWVARRGRPFRIPAPAAWFLFCNGMTLGQRKAALRLMCPESPNVVVDKADRSGMPRDVPITWIMTLRDRAVSPRQQQACVQALGGANTLLMIDTCHNVMFSEPTRLAAMLIERCLARSRH